MLSSAPMELFSVIILDQDLEKVAEMILRLGVLHLVKINELETWAQDLESAKTSQQQDTFFELEARIKNILKRLGGPKGINEEFAEYGTRPDSIEELTNKLNQIEKDINPELAGKESLEEQLRAQEEMLKQVEILGPAEISSAAGGRYTYLEIVTGKINNQNLVSLENVLKDVPNVILPFRPTGNASTVLVITLKKDHLVQEKALNEASFQRISVPEELGRIPGDVKLGIEKNIKLIKEKLSNFDATLNGHRKRLRPLLLDCLRQVTQKSAILNAQGYFQKSARTYSISGWIPVYQRERLIGGIKKLTGERCYIREEDPEDVQAIREKREQVPVLLSNPDLIRPFELLIRSYGIPEYNTLDPTILVALSFLIMFGAMFGDVGQGLVLLISGFFLLRSKKEFVSKAGTLIAYCGASSAFFGFLYGSIFGMEGIIPSLWMKPMDNIPAFLRLAVIFGIGMISLGVIINIINAIRTRNVILGIFDKAGLISGIIYWTGIGLAVKYFLLRSAPVDPKLLLGLVGLPILVLFLKAPVEGIIVKKGKIFPDGLLTYFIETIIEVAEIFMGYLANTISYIRIAAFALAHAGLFIAVFSLADMVRNSSGGQFWPVLIIILGNIFILLLEGLVVTIQGIRLEYYEFFSKFFVTEGKEYKPVKLGRPI